MPQDKRILSLDIGSQALVASRWLKIFNSQLDTPTQLEKKINFLTQLNPHFKLTQPNPYNMGWIVQIVELFGYSYTLTFFCNAL